MYQMQLSTSLRSQGADVPPYLIRQQSHRLSEVLLLLVQISPPEIKDTPEAPKEAARRLEKMGGMTRDEKIMLGTMGLAVVLWVLGDAIGVSSVVAAMLGEWLFIEPTRMSLSVEASMLKLAL